MVSTLYGNLIWRPVWEGKGEPAVAESWSGNKRADTGASRGDDKETVQTLIKPNNLTFVCKKRVAQFAVFYFTFTDGVDALSLSPLKKTSFGNIVKKRRKKEKKRNLSGHDYYPNISLNRNLQNTSSCTRVFT